MGSFYSLPGEHEPGVATCSLTLQLIARSDLSALLHAAKAAESLPVAFVAVGLNSGSCNPG